MSFQDEDDIEFGEPTINKGYFICSVCSFFVPTILIMTIFWHFESNSKKEELEKSEQGCKDQVIGYCIGALILVIALPVFLIGFLCIYLNADFVV